MARGLAAALPPAPCRLRAYNGLMVVLIAGAVTLVVAWDHRAFHVPVFVKVVGSLALFAVSVRPMLSDPLLPDELRDRPLSPTVVQTVASLLSIALLPWIGAAGLFGADLSTRPEFYAQVAQIIPVLLLAVVFERRFFSTEHLRVAEERTILRFGFVVLVVGPGLAEILALVAIAAHVRWVEAATTVLALSSIPALLVLIAGPVLVALYEPA